MKYDYDEKTLDQVQHALRLALPSGTPIKATLKEDFGGTDFHFIAAVRCAIQARCRFNRPFGSADKDVTFRVTEPAMIRAKTYAPLMLFSWFNDGWFIAGKLVDVYRMSDAISPRLEDRPRTPNKDGSHAFITVTIGELCNAGALLRNGDRNGWTTFAAGGMRRVEQILAGAGAKEGAA